LAIGKQSSKEELTPRQVVAELDKYIVGQKDAKKCVAVALLDKYIIGQKDAKKCVAVALRNRYRRKLLADDFREEVYPKNIIMIGPTGVGKTEIARRLAKLVNAPFVKVEATKFTEVGYVGRDVETIVRDLVETSVHRTGGKTCRRGNEGAAAGGKTFVGTAGPTTAERKETAEPFSFTFLRCRRPGR